MARTRVRGIKQRHPLGSVPSRSGVSQLTASSGVVTSLGVKISALPAAVAATDTDQFEANQGGVSRRLTVAQLLEAAPGLPEAPIDGLQYARQDAAWSVVEGGSAELPITGGDPVDTGLSRISAGVVGVGNGTAGSVSGQLRAVSFVAGAYFQGTGTGIDYINSGTVSVGAAGIFSFGTNYTVSDTGLSRVSAGTVAVGNGTAGNASGTMRAGTFTGTAGDAAFPTFGIDTGLGHSNGWMNSGAATLMGMVYGGDVFAFTNTSAVKLRTGGVYGFVAGNEVGAAFSNDTGLSRIAAGTVAVGNGTAGNASGTLNAAAVNLTGALAGTTATLTAAGTTGTVADVLLVSRTPFSATGTGARLYLSGSNNITRAAYIEGVNTTGSGGGHDLVFGTNVSTSAPVERMRITSGGNVAFTGTVLAPGAQIQLVSTQTGAVATGTTVLPYDDTIPQIGEGTEFMTLAITPKSATSTLVIEVTTLLSNSAAGVNTLAAALFQDSTANALAAMIGVVNAANHVVTVSFSHTVTSGSTTARTYRVRCGSNVAGTTTFNGAASARVMGGVLASSIVIREVAV